MDANLHIIAIVNAKELTGKMKLPQRIIKRYAKILNNGVMCTTVNFNTLCVFKTNNLKNVHYMCIRFIIIYIK